MLKSVEISNFQCYRSATISFVPGLNVITAPSDSGKSALIRALLWALNNKPSGEEFKSWKATEDDVVEVAMEFDNDWFTKKRKKNKNSYEAESGKYEALRTDVPEAIQNISNITDYNIQTQFQPYFMLQSTPGERAKKLNELVGLDIIDRVFKKVNSKIDDAKAEVKKHTMDIAELTGEIENLSYLASVTPQIEKLDDDITKHTVSSHRLDLLASLTDKLADICEEIRIERDILSCEAQYQNIMKCITHFNKLSGEIADLKECKDSLVEVDDLIIDWNGFLEAEPAVTKVTEKVNSFQHLLGKENLLATLSSSLFQINDTVDADKEWLSVEEPYTTLMNKLLDYRTKNARLYDLTVFSDPLIKIDGDLIKADLALLAPIYKYTELLEKSKVCPTCTSPINYEVLESIKNKLQER